MLVLMNFIPGKLDDYFRDRKALFKHFKRTHIVCPERKCMEEFKVFADEYELRHHTITEHPEKTVDRKVRGAFTVKRKGFDGSGREDSDPHGDSDGSFPTDSFSFAYRPGETPESVLADQPEGSIGAQWSSQSQAASANINSAEPTSTSWVRVTGGFQSNGNALGSTSEFPELGGRKANSCSSSWGNSGASSHQSSHSNFASAVGTCCFLNICNALLMLRNRWGV